MLERNLEHLIEIFSLSNVYAELQHRPTMPDQHTVNQALKTLSRERGIPLVATNDVHYVHTDDAAAHDVLLCLQTKSRLTDTKRLSYLGEDHSLLPADQMKRFFSETPEAISNTLEIAERCKVEIPLGKISLPRFDIPDGKTGDEYLQELAYRGVEKRYHVRVSNVEKTMRDRLDYELDVIRRTGFADYFLIVQDFVNWAKDNEVMVGPGRGSAAGSLVSYLIGITNIDPLEYNLLFERFLNPDRPSPPESE